MLAKLTAKNQITIPKKVVDQLPDVKYFDVQLKDGVVVLKPLRVYDTDLGEIRSRIKKLGLKPDCVAEAIRWARSK
jgi:bifunctional DNA-binding transcriptional regulator/antitoxin component of YhaV-PrlF toxin-antitoxin module